MLKEFVYLYSRIQIFIYILDNETGVHKGVLDKQQYRLYCVNVSRVNMIKYQTRARPHRLDS